MGGRGTGWGKAAGGVKAGLKGERRVRAIEKAAGRRMGFQMRQAIAAGRGWRGVGATAGRTRQARRAAGRRAGGRRGR